MSNIPQSLKIALLFVFLLIPSFALAADTSSLSMTLTPPIFQVTQAPGTEWKSVLKLVNTNNYDLTVTATIKDFHPDGETGNAVFDLADPGASDDSHRMSGWIEAPKGNIIIKRGTTGEIPFTIHVPVNADPGGHYAAILVGTMSDSQKGESGVGIGSVVTSLIFLRVPGDVVEEGSIRDFYSENSILQTPDASFVLRFENKGNVHLIPQGTIVITNMWGKERGKIDINEKNTFGNVLPSSTRKFEFKWEGESNPFEFGRYKAFATLVYGEDGRKSVFRTAYFWVVPLKPVLSIFGGLIFFVWFIMWTVRRYVKKALAMERERIGFSEDDIERGDTNIRPQTYRTQQVPRVTVEVLRRPLQLRENMHDRNAIGRSENRNETRNISPSRVRREWLKHNRPFLGFILVLILGFSLIGWYFVEVFQSERTYHMEQIKNHQ